MRLKIVNSTVKDGNMYLNYIKKDEKEGRFIEGTKIDFLLFLYFILKK